jgi:hypothetical protein
VRYEDDDLENLEVYLTMSDLRPATFPAVYNPAGPTGELDGESQSRRSSHSCKC